jgi:hypothetical protein
MHKATSVRCCKCATSMLQCKLLLPVKRARGTQVGSYVPRCVQKVARQFTMHFFLKHLFVAVCGCCRVRTDLLGEFNDTVQPQEVGAAVVLQGEGGGAGAAAAAHDAPPGAGAGAPGPSPATLLAADVGGIASEWGPAMGRTGGLGGRGRAVCLSPKPGSTDV